MMEDIDDGGDKPIGYVTPDGELEVRESVDRTGALFHGYHETELGQHQRWMRSAPDLFEKHQLLLTTLAAHEQEIALQRKFTTQAETLYLEQKARAEAAEAQIARLKEDVEVQRQSAAEWIKIAGDGAEQIATLQASLAALAGEMEKLANDHVAPGQREPLIEAMREAFASLKGA